MACRENSYRVFFVLNGNLETEINGRKITLTENEMLIVTPFMHSAVSGGEDGEYIMLTFSTELPRICYSGRLPAFFNGNGKGVFTRELTDRYGIADRLTASAASDSELLADSVALYILYCVTEEEKKTNLSNFAENGIRSRLNEILTAVENETGDCNEVEFAGRFSMSYSYFSRTFKSVMGMSFKEYANFIKVNRAKQLLLTADADVKSLASDLGFSSPSHFINVFKNQTGISPGQYAKKRKR